MKKTLTALALSTVLLAGCATNEEQAARPDENLFTEDEAGAMLFGIGAMLICVQSGACVPI